MTIITKMARVAAPLAFAALFGLAACSKDPAPEQPENYVQNDSADEIPPEATPPAPEIVNEAPPANVAIAAPPADDPSVDQQVQEDADASGMTSRLSRSDNQSSEQEPAQANGEKQK